MALDNEMKLHLERVFANRSKFSKASGVTTIKGDLDTRQLKELIDVAQQNSHDIYLQAGALKVRPV